jgi:hypothetical protein
MTIIEKIKQSIEGATGMPFLYHAAGELNELIARCKELPVAYSFLIDSGTIDDVNGRYHERVTLAVMFCDKTEFDFNALENEQIIDRMKVKAYKWLQSLRMSNALRIVAVNNTQRLYDNTTDILTGFAVNITIEDVAGVGECELPQVVIDVEKNGSYDVVGVDSVRVNVVPKLEDLEVTQNGEYLPPTDIAGFSKVSVDVQPVLEELTITQNGEYTPQDGVDGFSKVVAEFDTSSLPKVKVSTFKVGENCIDNMGYWVNEVEFDWNYITSLSSVFAYNKKIKYLDVKDWDVSNVENFSSFLDNVDNLKRINGFEQWNVTNKCTSMRRFFVGVYGYDGEDQIIDLRNWDVSNITDLTGFIGFIYGLYGVNIEGWDTRKVTSFYQFFYSGNVKWVNAAGISAESVSNINYIFQMPSIETIVGDYSINDVINTNIKIFDGLKISTNLSNPIKLNRASLRAVINGLADLTGKTAQTLTIGAILLAKLTEEDIAIATNKNWTIV